MAGWEHILLLSMTADGATVTEDQTWPEITPLRGLLRDDPSHVPAMTLLAARIAQREDRMDEPDAEALAEAAELVTRLRRAVGDDPHFTAGLDRLDALIDPELHDEDADDTDPYGYHVLEDLAWSGSVEYRATIVASTRAQIRRGCELWLPVWGRCGISGAPILTTFERGVAIAETDLSEHFDGGVDWETVDLPEPDAPPLPPGLPPPGLDLHYGFDVGAG